MGKQKRRSCVLLGALSCALCLSASPDKSRALVWPGVGVGKIRLGDSIRAVRQKCGLPESVEARGKGWHTEIYKSQQVSLLKDSGTVRVFFSDGRVRQIQLWSPRYKIPGGVSTATRLSRHPERSRFTRHVTSYRRDFSNRTWLYNTYFDDAESGVALEMGIHEGPVGLDRAPNSIIIHYAGAEIIAGREEERQEQIASGLAGMQRNTRQK